MKSLKLSGVILFFTVFTVLTSFGQTVDEVIAKHIEAIGGKEKIDQINSLYMEATMQVMGNEAPSKIYILNGKGYRSEMEFGGQSIVQAYTDKGGWMINPMMGATTAQAMPEEQYNLSKDQMYIGGPLYNYAAKGNKVELLGKENNQYKIKATSGKHETTYFIDDNTYHITKTVTRGNMQGQDVDITINFSNYKKTDFGFVMPNDIQMDFGGFSMASNVKKIEINKAIDPKIFEMPK